MAPRNGGFSSSYAFFIIALMILGVIAGAFYFYRPGQSQSNPCYSPPPAQFSTEFTDSIDNTSYDAILANFTNIQENINFAQSSFLTVTFSDPSQPHLVSGSCATDKTTPAIIYLQVTFSRDQTSEVLHIQYNGDLTTQQQAFTSHMGPRAGVIWKPGQAYIELLVG